MSPNDLVKSVREQPFSPFRIVMTDGSTHDVTHPELLNVGIRTSLLVVRSRTRPEYMEDYIKIDNLHITKLVPLDSVAVT